MSQKQEAKTKGTVMAEKIRAKTNRLDDETRERLLGRAREIMNGARSKPCVNRP